MPPRRSDKYLHEDEHWHMQWHPGAAEAIPELLIADLQATSSFSPFSLLTENHSEESY